MGNRDMLLGYSNYRYIVDIINIHIYTNSVTYHPIEL